MKIITPILSENLLYECRKSFFETSIDQTWISSFAYWHPDLLKNISGCCNTSGITSELHFKIEKEISKYLPEYETLEIKFYAWHKHSGICLHNDGNFRFGATIYLDEYWDPEWGGLFIWYEKNDCDNPNIFIPKSNYMILNNEKEQHMVTEISAYAKTIRKTLQIFAK